MHPGNLFCIEGIDGAGKTTTWKAVHEILSAEGYDVVPLREPGGTPFGDHVRKGLLDQDLHPCSVDAELFAFSAARSELLKAVIRPMLQKGAIVITDRFDASTYAYQISGGQQRDLIEIFSKFRNRWLGSHLSNDPIEPVYIFLELDTHTAMERIRRRLGEEATHFDLKPLEFHERVKIGYKEFFSVYGTAVVVDASQPLDDVVRSVLHIIHDKVGHNSA